MADVFSSTSALSFSQRFDPFEKFARPRPAEEDVWQVETFLAWRAFHFWGRLSFRSSSPSAGTIGTLRNAPADGGLEQSCPQSEMHRIRRGGLTPGSARGRLAPSCRGRRTNDNCIGRCPRKHFAECACLTSVVLVCLSNATGASAPWRFCFHLPWASARLAPTRPRVMPCGRFSFLSLEMLYHDN